MSNIVVTGFPPLSSPHMAILFIFLNVSQQNSPLKCKSLLASPDPHPCPSPLTSPCAHWVSDTHHLRACELAASFAWNVLSDDCIAHLPPSGLTPCQRGLPQNFILNCKTRPAPSPSTSFSFSALFLSLILWASMTTESWALVVPASVLVPGNGPLQTEVHSNYCRRGSNIKAEVDGAARVVGL